MDRTQKKKKVEIILLAKLVQVSYFDILLLSDIRGPSKCSAQGRAQITVPSKNEAEGINSSRIYCCFSDAYCQS